MVGICSNASLSFSNKALPMKKIPSINSGSMADIAFLLLIFFLVATTIEQDKGLLRKLPPKITGEPLVHNERNVLRVWVNSNNFISVNDKLVPIEELREVSRSFIDNRGLRTDWSESPEEAIISLKASTQTNYDTYIQVQNELAAAYHELRDGFSKAHYGREFYELESEAQIKAVKKKYPMRISEAEPNIEKESLSNL